jgi:hypothetical protein
MVISGEKPVPVTLRLAHASLEVIRDRNRGPHGKKPTAKTKFENKSENKIPGPGSEQEADAALAGKRKTTTRLRESSTGHYTSLPVSLVTEVTCITTISM